MTALSSVRPATEIATARCSAPRLAADVVERGRLFEVLDRGIGGPLTLITGPPGAGKTTLLSSWLARCTVPAAVAWLSVDRTDATPAQFWSAVIEAVEHAGEPRVTSLMGRLGLDGSDFLSALADAAGYPRDAAGSDPGRLSRARRAGGARPARCPPAPPPAHAATGHRQPRRPAPFACRVCAFRVA